MNQRGDKIITKGDKMIFSIIGKIVVIYIIARILIATVRYIGIKFKLWDRCLFP